MYFPDDSTKGSMTRTILTNLGVSLLSLLVFFGSMELICRIWYEPKPMTYPKIYEYDRDKVFALKKSLKNGLHMGQTVITNSFGHRDKEIPVEKSPGVIRVLVLGDSVTFGHGVDMESSYPEILEEKLNQEIRSSSFDVINTGVPGNSAFQEYFDLKRGLIFDPDVIILQFVLNDVAEPFKVFKRYGGNGISYHKVPDTHWIDHLLKQNSALYLLLADTHHWIVHRFTDVKKTRIEGWRKRRALTINLAAREPINAAEIFIWKEFRKQLKKIADLAHSKKIPILLFASPVNFQLTDPTRTYAQSWLKEFAAENNISFYDILPDLRLAFDRWIDQRSAQGKKLEPKKFWHKYFLDHDHYNDRGHQFVADQIFPYLSDLLPKIDGQE